MFVLMCYVSMVLLSHHALRHPSPPAKHAANVFRTPHTHTSPICRSGACYHVCILAV